MTSERHAATSCFPRNDTNSASGLAESEHVAVEIADGEFVHVVPGLEHHVIHHLRAARAQLGVESTNIADPEEYVPRSSLTFVRHDPLCFRYQTQHDAKLVAH